MRYGVIADVHGNLHALEAVIERLDAWKVERYLCAGDLVGYGPFPNECVRRVAGLPATCVAGNHDLMALGRLSDSGVSALARETLAWTRAVLDDSARGYLQSLPLVERVDRVVLTHGSLDGPSHYIWRREQATAALQRLGHQHPAASLLVVGHTHASVAHGQRSGRTLSRRTGSVRLSGAERFLLNPGAVGQSRQRSPHARALVLDCDRHLASFVDVPYDIEACRRALRERGLPQDSVHRKPPATVIVARAIGRLSRATGAGRAA